MSNYSLTLLIDSADLRILKSSQLNIALAKPVGNSSSQPNVIWQCFDPFENNTVTWEEIYGCYASDTAFSNGAYITKKSSLDLVYDGNSYEFGSDSTFRKVDGMNNIPQGSFQIENKMPLELYRSLTFGLTQSATINGNETPHRPLNAQTVPSQFSAEFTPLTTIYAWLQAYIKSETMITSVVNRATKVVFGGDKTTITLKFDPNSGMFIPTGINRFIAETPNVELLNPTSSSALSQGW